MWGGVAAVAACLSPVFPAEEVASAVASEPGLLRPTLVRNADTTQLELFPQLPQDSLRLPSKLLSGSIPQMREWNPLYIVSFLLEFTVFSFRDSYIIIIN